MQVNYAPFIDRMIKRYEGGYCWDKGDPGGPTKYGITCWDLAAHRGQKMNSMTAWAPIVRAMSLAEAETIYASKYATAVRFNEIPAGVDCVMMDYAVNSGTARAIRVANALLKLPRRAKMTEDLFAALVKVDAVWFIRSMNAERLAFMHRIRGGSAWKIFGHGWQARVDDLTEYALHVAENTNVPLPKAAPEAVDLSKVATPKASNDSPTAGRNAVKGSAAAIVAQAATAKQAGFPWWQIGAVAVVIVIAGIAYYIYKTGKAAKENAHVVLPPDVIPQGAA
jgi:lysozyme family protein